MPRGGAVSKEHGIMSPHRLLPLPLRPCTFRDLDHINFLKAIQVHADPAITDVFDTWLEAGSFVEHNVIQPIGLQLRQTKDIKKASDVT